MIFVCVDTRVFDQCTVPMFNVDSEVTISDAYVLSFFNLEAATCANVRTNQTFPISF